ncbi:peptidase domain-containing protein [Methanocella conradii]|uniref:peptidase domain-containing protein n=1 Tax=Methanocella conradii TaxID=1175444 RepID=UPI00157DB2B7|nr:peptidase domain-containing protein [Methanocella conradii]
MSVKKCGVVLVLLALLAGVAAASAGAASVDSSKNIKPGDGGYVVTIGKSNYAVSSDKGTSFSILASLSDYISQGQIKWGYKTISGYVTSFGAELYWGNPANSLSMTIITPDGYVLGPYYDIIDGRLNGDIPIVISRSSGVAQGTYAFKIYGDQVAGFQYFTFS